MNRIKRMGAMVPAVVLLLVVAPDWWSSPRDYNPIPVVLGFLLALCLLFYLVRFTAAEVAVVTITTAPALYLIFHGLCGSTVAEACLLVARLALALALYFLISSIIDTFASKSTTSILRLLAALCIPFLWTVVLVRQSVFFSLFLTILTALLWVYRRSSKNRG